MRIVNSGDAADHPADFDHGLRLRRELLDITQGVSNPETIDLYPGRAFPNRSPTGLCKLGDAGQSGNENAYDSPSDLGSSHRLADQNATTACGDINEPRQACDMTETTNILTTRIQEIGDGVALLELAGEIDLSSAASIETEFAALAERGLSIVIVDATKVTFMDSTGVHALIKGKRVIHEQGSAIYMVPSPPVRRLLELISPGPLFAARFDTIEEAMGQLNADRE
jgi:anti-sigma B factor antagonist